MSIEERFVSYEHNGFLEFDQGCTVSIKGCVAPNRSDSDSKTKLIFIWKSKFKTFQKNNLISFSPCKHNGKPIAIEDEQVDLTLLGYEDPSP